MIPVTPAPPPGDFDRRVRQPGLRAIAELVGEGRPGRRPGRQRLKVADRRDEIPAAAFPPLWRRVLHDMLREYRRLCAYLALYIEPATGSATIDHVVPKSKAWDRVYEWSNYRLACGLMNSRKGAVAAVLDPFEIQDGWFALEFVELQVVPGDAARRELRTRVAETIERLGINDQECCEARRAYKTEYQSGHIDLDFLERRAPFVASELRRQGRLRKDDV